MRTLGPLSGPLGVSAASGANASQISSTVTYGYDAADNVTSMQARSVLLVAV